MNHSVKLLFILLLWTSHALVFGQDTRLVQVKLFNKTMDPVTDMEFSFDNIKRHRTNDRGVAVLRIDESKLPPKNVYVYDKTLEAESWNYSKGVLEIIIRKRTSKTIEGIVKNMLNEPIPRLEVTIGRVAQRKTTTNVYGEFEFSVPLDFNEKVQAAYSFDGYNIKQFEIRGDKLRFFLEEIPEVIAEEPAATVGMDSGPSMTDVRVLQPMDSTTDIAKFYNYLKGISLKELNQQQEEQLNDVFQQLFVYYEDSLKNNLYNRFSGISESSRIEDDLDYLIERARMEQNIASEFNRLFSEKIVLINRKLKSGGRDLSVEEREALIADIELLDQILRRNESLFRENQAEYREMLRAINTNLLDISDLEERLDLSEQQRIEQQQIYEQKVLFYTIGVVTLIVFLAVLGYFLARIKKQKDKTQVAYKKINELNEHLEELVEERTAMLEMTNAELDTFFYKSAHNLRRPLMTIVGLSEIAKMTLDEEAQKLFIKATETASSMDTMLRKLIMVSHINYPSDKDKVDFKDIVEKIEEDFTAHLRKHKIDFKKTIKSDSFISHSMLMDIVLRNLLENSFIFSTFSDKKPAVDLHITEDEKGLKITVSDNGTGVEASQEEKIWRMFYVAHENSSGNGLGLYIAQKAVKTLGGTIEYKRTSDEITQFVVEVPYTPERV